MNKKSDIRIRNATPAEKKRIKLAAVEAGLEMQTFCLYAALAACDSQDERKAVAK